MFFFLHVRMLQHVWSAATQFAMQDLGGRAMSMKTSKTRAYAYVLSYVYVYGYAYIHT